MKSEIKVKIQDISEAGYDLDDYLDPEYIGLGESDPGRFISPVEVSGTLYRTRDNIFGSLKAFSRYASFCYRTLEPVEEDIPVEVSINVSVAPNQQMIDLADEVRQELILNVPLRVLSQAEKEKDARGVPASFPIVQDDEGEVNDESDTYRPFEGLDLKVDDSS